MCSKCNKPYSTAIQRAFDKFPGPLQPGKDFGICGCPHNDEQREKVRQYILASNTLDQVTYCYALAAKLMQEHGLTEAGWRFDFSTSARRIAVCKHRTKMIEFSLHRLGSDPEVIKDIILHEIAHALVGVNYNSDGTKRDIHGPEWQAMCLRIGAKPNRLSSGTTTSKNYNFEIVCTSCGAVVARRYRVKQSLINGTYFSKCCKARLEAYDIRED